MKALLNKMLIRLVMLLSCGSKCGYIFFIPYELAELDSTVSEFLRAEPGVIHAGLKRLNMSKRIAGMLHSTEHNVEVIQ